MPDSFSSDTYDELCNDAEKCLAEGSIEQAREQLIKAVSLIHTRARARSLLADACMGMELWSEARTQLESLLTIDEDNPKNILRLGQVLEELGEKELAIDNYEVVLKMEPDNHIPEVALKRLKQNEDSTGFDLEQIFASSESTADAVEEETNVEFEIINADDDTDEDEPEEESFVLIDEETKPSEAFSDLINQDESEDENIDVDHLLRELGISSENPENPSDTEEDDSVSELLNSLGVSSKDVDAETDDYESSGEMVIGGEEEEDDDDETDSGTAQDTEEKESIEIPTADEKVVVEDEEEGTYSSIEVLFGETDTEDKDADEEKKVESIETQASDDIDEEDETESVDYTVEQSSDNRYFQRVTLHTGIIILRRDRLQAFEHKLRVETVESATELVSISGTGWFLLHGKSEELVVIEKPGCITVRESAVVLKDPKIKEESVKICPDAEFIKLDANDSLPLIMQINECSILEASSPNPSLVADSRCLMAFEKTVKVADADLAGYLEFSGYGYIYLSSAT